MFFVVGFSFFVIGSALFFGLRKEKHVPPGFKMVSTIILIGGLCTALYGFITFDETPRHEVPPAQSMNRPR